MEKYQIIQETLAYITNEEVTNTRPDYLSAGSQNVIIDRNRKVRSRPGYSRLGSANALLTPVRNGFTWHTSTELQLPIRFVDDDMQVYLGTLDGTVIDDWKLVKGSFDDDIVQRSAKWFDATENIDLLITINGDASLYEWSGAVAVVDSIASTTITKTGTATFAENRFYTTRNMTVVCVRTGTEYTYTGGTGTTTLTGISATTGLIAGDILVQKVVVRTTAPIANRKNHTIWSHQNQIALGSELDEKVYVSKNSSYYDFTFSTPRLTGEGALLTLDDSSKGFGSIGQNLICFVGRSGIFRVRYNQITVGTTLTETLDIKKLDSGIEQGAFNQETIVPMGNSLLYLTNEPALRVISDPDNLQGINPTTYSNPIKPDFDNEDWTNACAMFWKNAYYLSAPASSRVYILEFVQDADGKTRRFWQPPQILPTRAFSIIDDWIHGHSNSVGETYKIFDNETYSDISSDDEKLPYNAVARFAYRTFGDRTALKNFDEYYVDGELTTNVSDLLLTLRYGFEGNVQTIEKIIDGQDADILQGIAINASLGQNSLSQQPLGGSLAIPTDANKFQVVFEIPKEDFTMLQAEFSTNAEDRFWSIISHGGNVKMSPRKNTLIKK